MIRVGVDKLGGVLGTNQVMLVLLVLDVPVANTVGVLHNKVWVRTFALTFGATVFCKIGTEIVVRQKLELSCTMTVHVPGIVVTVELFTPRIMLGVTTPVKVGGKKVKLQIAGGV